MGQFNGHFVHKGEACQHTVFVVKGLKTNLLGLPTIMALNLITRVNEVSDYSIDIPKKFPKVFQGLGTMGEAGIQSLLDLPLTSCVVTVIKGHMDVINAQLERQYATDAKRKDTTTRNVTPKWEQINTMFPQRLVLIHHS